MLKITITKYESFPLIEAIGIVPSSLGDDVEEIKLEDNDSFLSKGYTSSYLKTYVKDNILCGYKIFNDLGKKISLLIDKNIIVPVLTQKRNDSLFIINQLPIYKSEKHTMGFFDPATNKIYLFLSNLSTGGIGNFSDFHFIELIIHELMHYFCANFINDYIELVSPLLIDFFNNLFSTLFDINNIDKNLLRNYIVSNIKLEKNMVDVNNTKYIKKLAASINDLVDWIKNNQSNNIKKSNYSIYKNNDSNIKNFIGIFNLVFSEKEDILQELITINKKFLRPAMLDSYDFIIKKHIKEFKDKDIEFNISSIFYQELLFSSEILAIWAGHVIESIIDNQIQINSNNLIVRILNQIIKNLSVNKKETI